MAFKNKISKIALISAATIMAIGANPSMAETLRLLTWGGYAPENVVAKFTAETGIKVEVTLSNNEEMIAKLRATGGGGFDLAQPSQDRVAGAQVEYDIYKPMNLSKIDTSQFIIPMLNATKAQTTIGSDIYGVPHVWGTSGLIVNSSKASDVKDYLDLCNPAYAGKVSYRLKRPTLIGFAFSMGLDPFAAYSDVSAYEDVMSKVEAKLVECKANVKTYWSGDDEIINLLRSGEVVAAMAWGASGWKLNADNADIIFVAPKAGALGWIDAFVLPKEGKADDAAYSWINFVMQPEVAAMITAQSGNFTASLGADTMADDALKARFQASFPPADIDNIRWYPPVPAGLETIESSVFGRINATK